MIHKKLQATFFPGVLVLCFVLYMILSWILLFRDKRALEGISSFYPQLTTFLFSTREMLLQNNLNTIPTLIFGLISVIALYIYFRSLTIKISLQKTIVFGLLFQLITLFSYPILSTDIFSYIFSERVATVHNENIWKVKPATFSEDQFSYMADWKETTSVYGGVHFIAYLLPSLIGQNNLLLVVSLYKLVPAIFGLATGYILYLLLKLYKPEYLEKGLRLVFWSPLFVLEIFGSGHNDSIMIFFTLLSILLYKKKLWFYAGVVIALAVQVKILPMVLLFFFALSLLRKKLFRSLLFLLSAFIATNALLFFFMQVNPLDFLQRVLYNNGVYWQSLINLLRFYFDGANAIILFGFLFWLIYFTLRQWKNKIDPVFAYASVLLVYLLFVSSAYWNWYILWILPLLPFIKDRKILWTVIVFSSTSLLAYPLLWISLRFGFGSTIWPPLTYIFIFGLPIITYLLLYFKEKSVDRFLKRIALQEVFADKA